MIAKQIDNKKSIDRCLHQFIRPSENLGIVAKDVGNCYTCQYDPIENKKCAGYYKISINTFNVEYRK